MADQVTTTFNSSFARQLATESWALYGVGVLIFCLRITTKCWFTAFRRPEAEDYVSLVALMLYTGLIVCLNTIAQGGGSNLYPPGADVHFTPQEIKERILGSKIVVASEQCMLCCIYALKTCVLLFYLRLTKGLPRQRMVQYVAIAVALGWVGSEIAFFTACRPFHGYWAVPPPNPQCTTLQHYAYVQASFNIPTDAAMLCITIPLIYKLQLPLKQKLLIGLVFSMGIFIIIAAILTKVFNLSDVYSTSYMLWYVREASTATYVANLPATWPLIRHLFPCLRNASSLRYTSSRPQYNHYGFGDPHGRSTKQRTGNATTVDVCDLDTRALRMDDMSQKSSDQDCINVMTTVEVTKEAERV